MASAKIYSIGLFIDGNYCWLIDKGLKGDSRRVNFKGLIKFIQKSIAEKYGGSIVAVAEDGWFKLSILVPTEN